MNYILGKFTTEQELQQAENKLKELGFVSSKTNKKCGDALRVYNRDNVSTYTSGDYTNYLRYKKQGMASYVDCTVLTLEEFLEPYKPKDSKSSLNERKLALQKELAIKATIEAQHSQEVFPLIPLPSKSSTTPKWTEVEYPYVHVDKSKLLNTYSRVSHELKSFLRLLFGDELFIEKTYKVGDKFSRRGETLVIAKLNHNVVSVIDCNTFENLSPSTQVITINAITESELKCLLGVWRDEFNLIK